MSCDAVEPPEPGGEVLTGLACPDCPGTLRVRRLVPEVITFVCRIGHVYTLPELIAAKERGAEAKLWAAVCALDELHALLRDTGLHPDRAERVLAEIALLRRLIEETIPAPVEAP